jgi:predicted TIM-barrel fold metal-dependent hydrolase
LIEGMRAFDFRAVPRIEECLGSWTPPRTIRPHLRYIDLYRMHERVQPIPIEEMVDEMRAAGVVGAVICAADNETVWQRKTPNAVIAALVERYPDFFVGFAGADPHKGMHAVREFEHAVRDLGLRGLNLAPWLHQLLASDKRYYPLYAKAAELEVPVVLHSSSHFDPGVTMETGNPVHLDEVACHFPELTLVASHAGWPWVMQMVAVAWRHSNVWLEFSGILPEYWDPELVSRFETPILGGRVLWATDYPLIEWKRSLDQVAELPLSQKAKQELLYDNAARLLGLPV